MRCHPHPPPHNPPPPTRPHTQTHTPGAQAHIHTRTEPRPYLSKSDHFVINPLHSIVFFRTNHYNDVIMSAMASQTASISIVCPTVAPGADQRKHQSAASSMTGEFPAQRGSNAENVSIWWRHHEPTRPTTDQLRCTVKVRTCTTGETCALLHLSIRGPFTKMVWLSSQHREVFTCPLNCGILVIYSKTSTVQPLKFGDG